VGDPFSYICYPYYWADSARWADLAVIQGGDQNFADFLRAGSARVILAARPGFENQVNFYVLFGILWGGGPMPAPGDPDYLSIADEIRAQQQRPIDVTVIDTRQVRLPTTLIWLENFDKDGKPNLPNNLSPSIDTTPKIVSLSPNAGTIGDLVTIAGRNFGDTEGSSDVKFNGIEALPTTWSATSIDVSVPANAATGPVIVIVNGVASNSVNFTVN
jgi:IPT/TIG domain-containing protein